MSDVIVSVDVACAAEADELSQAIEAFTQWRFEACGEAGGDCADAPEIMVKTAWTQDAVKKTLIFQERRWADAFMDFWRG